MTLWTIQVFLTLAYLFSGTIKLITPSATLLPMIGPLPIGLVRFIGACEVTGALGLVLPGLFGIRPILTPIAASGLVIIMSGAVSACITRGLMTDAIGPAVLGILAIVIAYGRFALAPLRARGKIQ